jgi:uncharacterized protein with ParB-like and HNH nuclease domain
MAEQINNLENPNFRLKAIAELLDGEHHFYIPSYQRGYRWDKKQVEDLLKDISDFSSNSKKGDFYCLQPIVVKSKIWKNKEGIEIGGWEVIDGQQRLTTLLLLLKYLRHTSDDAKESKAIFYSIQYQTRPELDFDNLVKDNDIDSFHAYSAITTIEQWFKENTVKKSKLVEVLFDDYQAKQKSLPRNEWEPQVKVIWYVTENEKDIDSIKIFNNLNKGKIRLTNAELIKALFVLKTQEYKNNKKVEDLNIEELAYEWNEIESSLQDNRLWYFIANKDYTPSTRIDLIFDFLTEKNDKADDDFAYRRFQDLYDNPDDSFWDGKSVKNFTEGWKKVKEVYQTFIYWYENSSIYHYVGYLIYNGISIQTIYNECKGKTKSDTITSLQKLIGDKLLNFNKQDIDSFEKDENYKECKRILLFFNIETSIKQQINQNSKVNNLDSVTYYKFPFDLLKLYDWDIEHVGSKTENPLNEVKDKIVWLGYIADISCDDENWTDIQNRAKALHETLIEKKKDEGNKFKDLYSEIISVVQKNENDTKDTLDNLALLDSSTNRGYGNALFPTKRKTIIENDMNGVFIPVCTKNLFLKYYSSNDESNTQWKNSWEDNDRIAYLKAIHDTIDFILK